MTKQEFADVVQAWAEGATIQFRMFPNAPWYDEPKPYYAPTVACRIKPKSVRWRAALFATGSTTIDGVMIAFATDDGAAASFVGQRNFVRWLCDWQEVEV
jgi:hypothetical protein